MRSKTQPDHHYIVKDNFIINLKKGRKKCIPKYTEKDQQIPTYIKGFCQMINKKQ